jgi:hypothetical protein
MPNAKTKARADTKTTQRVVTMEVTIVYPTAKFENYEIAAKHIKVKGSKVVRVTCATVQPLEF